LTIRAIRADDAPRLQAFHTRLSPETIYGRYLGAHPMLSDAEVERFTHVDGIQRMAFVATLPEDGGEAIIGVARYDCLGPAHCDEAEAAIVVEDRHQSRGVGTLLLNQLTAHARSHGICAFVAEISAEHDRLLDFIRRSGYPMQRKLESGVWEIRVPIG
jgi:GNAT superfamily N-acetyltransferase